ncbi:hypothetical protein [Nocardia sp. NPDC057353]|uniref:hypothetical protein n=1 Tax=Nocardia sp. NPDC057353 TaxID=3346104 RepID=UPI003641A12F
MNPELPQSQPAVRPPPFQARSDRDVLSPNQRIVFLAGYLFVGYGLLVAATVVGYLNWQSDLETWSAADSSIRGDSPSLLEYLLASASFFAVVFGCPLVVMIAVLKGKLRSYVMDRPFRS